MRTVSALSCARAAVDSSKASMASMLPFMSIPLAHQPFQLAVFFELEQGALQPLVDKGGEFFASNEIQLGAVHHLRQDAHLVGGACAHQQPLQAGAAVEEQASASGDQLLQVQLR